MSFCFHKLPARDVDDHKKWRYVALTVWPKYLLK